MSRNFRLPSLPLSSLLALCLALPCVACRAHAQAATGQMTIRVTVDSRSGEPVEGLTAADFTLFDNKKPQPITAFHAVTKQPTQVVIVLDAVNLPYTQVSFARQQLAQFFSANGGKLAQPTTLGVLMDRGMQIQPGFTTDGKALRSSLDRFSIGLRELTRSTGFFGADERLEISLNMLKGLVAQLPAQGTKRIIWISAGWPLLSGPAVELSPANQRPIFSDIVGLATELRRLQITMDDVNPLGAAQDVAQMDYYESFLHGARNPRDVQLGDLGLQVLAVQSGGLVLNGSNNIAGLIQKAIDQTRSFYELSFLPAPGEHENEYHELQVKVARPGLTVHTTAGYYARPVYAPLERPTFKPPTP
jgi:VWFA-related protein